MYREGLEGMHTRIKISIVAVGVTYVATILSILLGCRPLQKNWQINPDPGSRFALSPPGRDRILICFRLLSASHIEDKSLCHGHLERGYRSLPDVYSATGISFSLKVKFCRY